MPLKFPFFRGKIRENFLKGGKFSLIPKGGGKIPPLGEWNVKHWSNGFQIRRKRYRRRVPSNLHRRFRHRCRRRLLRHLSEFGMQRCIFLSPYDLANHPLFWTESRFKSPLVFLPVVPPRCFCYICKQKILIPTIGNQYLRTARSQLAPDMEVEYCLGFEVVGESTSEGTSFHIFKS